MKKNTLILILIAFAICQANAQQKESVKRPSLIILGGLGSQWFDQIYRTWSQSAEVQVDPFVHVGIGYHHYLKSPAEYSYFYYEEELVSSSFEISVYGKYFFHGRFTGRKSGFFIGPDFRFGQRRVKYYSGYYSPFPSPQELPIERYRTTKIMVNIGAQWQLGKHACLALEAPMGFEHQSRLYLDYMGVITGRYSVNPFVIIPAIKLGFKI